MTLPAEMLETPRKVGSTPSMTHGWRPYSATNQPSSAAIHGSGSSAIAAISSQRVLEQRAPRREPERDGEEADEEEARARP